MATPFSDHPRSAIIQVPLAERHGAKRNIACIFNGMQGKRLLIEASEALAVSTAVSVEYDDSLFLGEVVTCSETKQAWELEIKVEQVLTGLQSLMALRNRLLSEGVAQPGAVASPVAKVN